MSGPVRHPHRNRAEIAVAAPAQFGLMTAVGLMMGLIVAWALLVTI
jgi:hypothetical protein